MFLRERQSFARDARLGLRGAQRVVCAADGVFDRLPGAQLLRLRGAEREPLRLLLRRQRAARVYDLRQPYRGRVCVRAYRRDGQRAAEERHSRVDGHAVLLPQAAEPREYVRPEPRGGGLDLRARRLGALLRRGYLRVLLARRDKQLRERRVLYVVDFDDWRGFRRSGSRARRAGERQRGERGYKNFHLRHLYHSFHAPTARSGV